MHKDLYHSVEPKLGLTPTASSTAEVLTGEIVDTVDFESGQAVLVVPTYSVGDVAIKDVLESDDSGMSGATAIPADRIIGDINTLAATGETDIGFVRTKRYVQMRVETTGASVSLSSSGL